MATRPAAAGKKKSGGGAKSAKRSAAKSSSKGSTAAKKKSTAAKKSTTKRQENTAQVTLRGRFRPGTRVRLYKSARPEALRHSEGDELLAAKKVDGDGVVRFTSADGVELGGRYFIYGHIAGQPQSVRISGREPGDEAGIGQRPVGVDDVRHGDGVLVGDRGQPKADVPEAKVETDEGA
jgi:hypothetical protein